MQNCMLNFTYIVLLTVVVFSAWQHEYYSKWINCINQLYYSLNSSIVIQFLPLSFPDNPVVVPNGKPLSIEAQQIIQKIPDISYMTSKTLVFPQVAASSSSSSSNSFL